MGFSPSFKAHLETGATTIARAWEVLRKDGVRFGFTDHDRDLRFDGLTFRADGGLSAGALASATGLSVDNSEALGALSSDGILETDIRAGRFDGARVKAWLVNWNAPEDRELQFRGTIGEIVNSGGAFRAELRGLAEALNGPRGRVYQAPCSAVLGDSDCKFDLNTTGYFTQASVVTVEDDRVLHLAIMPEFAGGWFERGRCEVLTGAASGLVRNVKSDIVKPSSRRIELWEGLVAGIEPGDQIRLEAGCDKRVESCQTKFGNFMNFRGFPHIPGEDWMTAYPRRNGRNDGGSLRK